MEVRTLEGICPMLHIYLLTASTHHVLRCCFVCLSHHFTPYSTSQVSEFDQSVQLDSGIIVETQYHNGGKMAEEYRNVVSNCGKTLGIRAYTHTFPLLPW